MGEVRAYQISRRINVAQCPVDHATAYSCGLPFPAPETIVIVISVEHLGRADSSVVLPVRGRLVHVHVGHALEGPEDVMSSGVREYRKAAVEPEAVSRAGAGR